MPSLHSLTKQKRRLSVLFSLAIFLVIIVLDAGFLFYRYFDYQRQELGRLSLQSQGVLKMIGENPIMEQDILQGKWLPSPMMGMHRGGTNGQPGTRGRIQMENFFLYDRQNNTILFSPQKDDELYGALLNTTQSRTGEWKRAFTFNENEYFFLNIPATERIGAVFFTESRITPENVLVDILIYLVGAMLLSLGVYVLSSRFVNSTLSPVEKNMEQMEQFIHNAGHELKTPLSVIKSSLELMKLNKKYDEGITESIHELDRMNSLIQALIHLSTVDENEENSESINITEVCEKLQKIYKESLDTKHISLNIVTKKPLTVRANREYTEIFLSNLLSNAIKYNRENGEINITIDQKSLTVQDTGIGIAKENLEKIFDRFYQENGTRTENSFGIGLSLVDRIASVYKWTVTVKSEKWVGTTVKVEF